MWARRRGIMDQFVVAGAVEHQGDDAGLPVADVRAAAVAGGVRVVICNSMVKHRLAEWGVWGSSRRGGGGAGGAADVTPGIELLRDATVADLEACREKMTCGELCCVAGTSSRRMPGCWRLAECAAAGRCGAVWADYGGSACEHAG